MKTTLSSSKTVLSLCLALVFSIFTNSGYAQLTVSPNKTAAQLANALTGPGVTISNATLNCPALANGTYTGATSPLSIGNGIVLTSGLAASVDNPASFFASPEDNGTGGDAALTALSGNPTFDACVLEFDFVPFGDSVKFRYQFGSEEYPNFTCTQFNDLFAFFISGPGYASPTNIALVPGTNIPVAINSVNGGLGGADGPTSNCTGMGAGSPFTSFFINNAGGTTMAYDGLTTVLTAKAAVVPCSTYHFKLGVADASDHILSSGVFLEEGSLSVLPPVITGCPSNIIIPTTATTCNRSVSWTPPTANNNCLDVTVSSTHEPGDVFPLGTTPVTYTFTNAGGSSTCTFNVTVVDNTPPTAICQNYTLDLVNGMGTVTPANINNGSFDNCSIAEMSVSPNTFTCADAGENTVTLTVIDGSGNISTCTATVTVQYQPSCTVSTTEDIIYLGYGPQTATLTANATGGSGFTYSWSPSTDLSCTNCQSPVFTPTAQGNYTYTVTVTNSNGCSTTCEITICVLDIRDPNHPNKVFICHVPGGNPGNTNTLSVSVNAVASHLAHGDQLGECGLSCESIQNKGSIQDAISAQTATNNIHIYPNPVTNMLTVQLPVGMAGAEATVKDVTGKVIQRKVSSGESTLSFDLSKEANGVYLIEVINGNDVHRAKVVKE